MAAYLTARPPVRDQWYAKRNRPLTGCTVLHTAESVMDTVGPDTGAEAVAEFIRTRSTPGSYHDLCDSDSAINLVDYRHGAYHDGTGSNNWALSISWACRTSDWRAMSPAKRRAFLRQGAIAFARQQAYRRSLGAPLTELRLISKAQSDRGESGFTYHGLRDPGRRTDPGIAAPNQFPFDEFITEVRAVMSGVQEDDMPYTEDDLLRIVKAAVWGSAAPLHPNVWPIDRLRRIAPFVGILSDPAKGGDGTVALAAPGYFLPIPSLAHLELHRHHGIVGEPVAACSPQEFEFYRTLFTTPIADDFDTDELITALREALPEAQAADIVDELDRRARDGDPATGPVS